MEYNHREIEQKWQKRWADGKTFEIADGESDYYILEMFPYPSGNIHMGHLRNYTIGDVLTRFARKKGKKVMHPFGWDAFGLPAENAAIERGLHPKNWTYSNVENMKKQLQSIGFAYDWSREITTCSPDYYRHEQKIFLDFLKAKIAYKKESFVNWDPIDQTVLANEQVIDGRGWRSGAVVEKKKLSQWFLRVSDFAEALLDDLKELPNWPEKVKLMQENWIGKSEGAEISFRVTDSDDRITVFTTRPETIFGASFLAISCHHNLAKLAANNNPNIQTFINQNSSGSTKTEDLETMEKHGIFTGLYVEHPFIKNKKIPIWIANFVLMDYGTGALFGCPAHDERDFEFATKYNLPITQVVSKHKNCIIETEDFYLRPFYESDRAIFHKWTQESDACDDVLDNKDWSERSFNRFLESFEKNSFSKFAIIAKNTNEFIGYAGFELLHNADGKRNPLDRHGKCFAEDLEIGYRLHKNYWNKGHATQIAQAIINWAFKKFQHLNRIVAVTEITNEASKRVLEKCEFEFIKNIKTENYGEESFFVLARENAEYDTKPQLYTEKNGYLINSDFLNGLSVQEAFEKLVCKYQDAIFETERFYVRPLKESDYEHLLKLDMENENNEFTPFLCTAKIGQKIEEIVKDRLQMFIKRYQMDGLSAFVIINKENDEFVGKCCIKDDMEYLSIATPSEFAKFQNKGVDFGYAILQKFQNHGIATEVGRSLIDYTFRNFNIDYITATAKPNNLPSRRVMIKCGLTYLADITITEDCYGTGVISDEIWSFHVLNREDYMKNKLDQKRERKFVRKTTYKLRDWGVSRQRYWGCPIPIIYCKDCGIVPVPECDLPVTLPDDVEVKVGLNPLTTHPTWKNCKCPKCGIDAERETDTFDTFFESSWYFLRYCSPNAVDEAFQNPTRANDYIGGIDHAILHLLYSRFFVKALKKCGYDIPFDEPFDRLITQGMVCHKTYKSADGKWLTPEEARAMPSENVTTGDSIKMSKSKKNVIEPLSIVEKYGADTARFFMMSDTPPDRDMEWSDDGVESSHKFLKRLWLLANKVQNSKNNASPDSKTIIQIIHRELKNYENDIRDVTLNKAISRVRILFNLASEQSDESAIKYILEYVLHMLEPFAPHISEEIWKSFGHDKTLGEIQFPKYDEKYLVDSEITIAIQVNGKLRGQIKVPHGSTEEFVIQMGKSDANVQNFLLNKEIKKTIYIPAKVVNFVII